MQEDQNIRQEQDQAPIPEKKKRFQPTKRFIIGGIILTVVVVLIVVAAFLLADSDRRPIYSLYVKDGSLYYTDFKEQAFLVTSNLTAADGNLPDVEYDLRYCATLSDNGNYLFFPENMKISGEDVQTFDLCYQNVKKDRQKILIAKDVMEYHISSDAMTVTYLTANGLYRYELKPAQSNLLCANVFFFRVSDNSSRWVYLTGNNELYAQASGYARVKIDNMVDEVLFVDEGFKSVIYRQENSLHKWVSGKGETEICADAINWSIYESGEALLLSNEDGYSKLFYYDGQDANLVMEHVEHLVITALEGPVCLLTAPASTEAPEDEEAVEPTATPVIKTYLISGKTVYEPELEGKRCVGMAGNGKTLYFVESEATYSTLYELSIGAFGLEDLKTYDEDVHCESVTVTADGKVIYYKNVNEETQVGTLFLNGTELNGDVPLHIQHYQNFSLLPDSKLIFYFTGYDPEKLSGVLHVASTDGTNRQISGSAIIPFMLHNGQILFMENYTPDVGGDLYVYINGSTILIDKNVTFYIPVM